jgi:hypothetical protein
MGTSSRGCKVSPISEPHLVHIYLTPNSRLRRFPRIQAAISTAILFRIFVTIGPVNGHLQIVCRPLFPVRHLGRRPGAAKRRESGERECYDTNSNRCHSFRWASFVRPEVGHRALTELTFFVRPELHLQLANNCPGYRPRVEPGASSMRRSDYRRPVYAGGT